MLEIELEELKAKRNWQQQAKEKLLKDIDLAIECEIDFIKEGTI
jgi:hypothetical protein